MPRNPKDWREARRIRAWELHNLGWAQRKIAEAFGVSEGAVSQWFARARDGGGKRSLHTRKKSGRPRKLSLETPRALGPYPHRNKWRVVYKGACEGESSREAEIFDNKEEAEIARDAFNDEAQGKNKLNVGQLISLYVENMEERGLKKSSLARARYHLSSFFSEEQRERFIRSFTPPQCKARYKALCDRGLSPDTHRNTLQEVGRFFRWCIKNRYADKDPSKEIEPMGRRSRGKAQLRLDGARKFFELVETITNILTLPNPIIALEVMEIRPPAWYHGEAQLPKFRRMIACGVTASLTALILGLRASEITNRKVSDLDDNGRLLHIEDTKTYAGERVLVVPDLLRSYLMALAKGQPPEAPLLGGKDRKLVLHWAKRLSVMAGVPPVTAHGLRGSFATIATAQGMAPQAVASALGHASTAVTEAHYTRPEAKIDSNAQRLAEILASSTSKDPSSTDKNLN